MRLLQFLETKIEKEIAMARRNAKTNKSVAMAALKRKKRLETQLQQIDGTLTTLETQRITLESANTNTAVLTTMGDAARAMRRAHADMDVEKVHDLMDDISEQQQVNIRKHEPRRRIQLSITTTYDARTTSRWPQR